MSTVRVGLLGGSFDPVHYGHLRAAQWALEAFALREVRLVPAKQSPFKGVSFASSEHRLAMLDLATRDNASLSVEGCELDREAPSYTVDTLHALRRRAPGAQFTLILGSDAAVGLGNWRDIDKVRQMAEIRILARPGDVRAWDPDLAVKFEGLSICSTALRTAVRSGRSIRYLTPEPVRSYIDEKGLYK